MFYKINSLYSVKLNEFTKINLDKKLQQQLNFLIESNLYFSYNYNLTR